MSKLEKIQNEILSLSPEERELVSIFLKNTQAKMETDYHQSWHEELQSRLDEINGGHVKMQPVKSVVADLRKSIAK